jgi:hypothetical protein
MTVPPGYAGLWLMTATGSYNQFNAGVSYVLAFALNGGLATATDWRGTVTLENTGVGLGSGVPYLNPSFISYLAVGDYVEVWTQHNKGSNEGFVRTGTGAGFGMVHLGQPT